MTVISDGGAVDDSNDESNNVKNVDALQKTEQDGEENEETDGNFQFI